MFYVNMFLYLYQNSIKYLYSTLFLVSTNIKRVRIKNPSIIMFFFQFLALLSKIISSD